MAQFVSNISKHYEITAAPSRNMSHDPESFDKYDWTSHPLCELEIEESESDYNAQNMSDIKLPNLYLRYENPQWGPDHSSRLKLNIIKVAQDRDEINCVACLKLLERYHL